MNATHDNHNSNDSRPVSAATNSSFDFASRPVSHAMPQANVANLSRTDQIVLRHFWEYKYEENVKRDLHFVSTRNSDPDSMANKLDS